ncbi:MAG: hypothetical protein ACRCYE_13060 [Sarcina sp.]
MKKAIIVIIIVIIIIGGAFGFFKYRSDKAQSVKANTQTSQVQAQNNQDATAKTQAASNDSSNQNQNKNQEKDTNSSTANANSNTNTDGNTIANASTNNENNPTLKGGKVFSEEDMQTYYKLSQNVGDIGLPSAAMTTNLDEPKTINGVEYYSTYSYNTRAAYNNDNSTPQNGNYSHLIKEAVVSLSNSRISRSEFGSIDTSKLNSTQIANQVYRIAAQYVEGYTANNPNLVLAENNNYEGNLNSVPDLTVSLNNPKQTSDHGNLYKVMVNINEFETPIYVGLDGYIFVPSQQDFYQLFFPNKAK